jgi:putative two-component system response regulator
MNLYATTWRPPLVAGLFSLIKDDARRRFISVNGAPTSRLNAQVIREIVEHSRRTGSLMEEFAKAALMALDANHEYLSIESRAQMLGAAALFHDVGKFAIPSSILGKPCKLLAEEYAVIKRHAEIGANMLGQAAPRMPVDFVRTAKVMAWLHHEHWDGSGYPLGLSGYQIPLAARLLAIVDVYDALVHTRAYKRAQSRDEAIRIIGDGRGKLFDPALVDLFIEQSRTSQPR